MRKLLAILTLCCFLQLPAQNINVGDRFLDNETGITYTVREVRMEKRYKIATEMVADAVQKPIMRGVERKASAVWSGNVVR